MPQGSLLGPLLFLLYVNDIANVSELLLPLIFADDTNLFVQGKNIRETSEIMNSEMAKILLWLNSNRLLLNIDKTHYMIFHSVMKRISTENSVKIGDKEIERVSNTKFIGVNLDEKLTWEKHILMVKSKVAKGLGILCKARKVFPTSILKTLYYSIVYPHLTYCVEVWGNASKTHIDSLFMMQKKVLRVITSAGFRAHTDPIFADLQLLKLSEIYISYAMTFVFKFMKGMLPKVFNNFFQRNCEVSSRITRNSHKLYYPKFKTTLFKSSFKYQCVTEWNAKIKYVDDKCSVHAFKKRIKNVLLERGSLNGQL